MTDEVTILKNRGKFLGIKYDSPAAKRARLGAKEAKAVKTPFRRFYDCKLLEMFEHVLRLSPKVLVGISKGGGTFFETRDSGGLQAVSHFVTEPGRVFLPSFRNEYSLFLDAWIEPRQFTLIVDQHKGTSPSPTEWADVVSCRAADGRGRHWVATGSQLGAFSLFEVDENDRVVRFVGLCGSQVFFHEGSIFTFVAGDGVQQMSVEPVDLGGKRLVASVSAVRAASPHFAAESTQFSLRILGARDRFTLLVLCRDSADGSEHPLALDIPTGRASLISAATICARRPTSP